MPVQITTSSNAPEHPLQGLHCLCQSQSLPTMQPYMWSYYLIKSLRNISFNCSSPLNTDDLSINQCNMNQRKDFRAHQVHKQASIREEEAARAPTLRHAHSKSDIFEYCLTSQTTEPTGKVPPITALRTIAVKRTSRRSDKRPTFLLFEGLDGARVVHHCDVHLVPSVRWIPYFKESNCSIHEKLWCGPFTWVLWQLPSCQTISRPMRKPKQHLSKLRML